MASDINKKEFLTQRVPELLKKLSPNTEPSFGLMPPQHMIEHITWAVKSSIKRNGDPTEAPNARQLGFKKFIENGAILQHRPSDKTKADLPALKYSSLEEAIPHVSEAVNRFYEHFENNPGFVAYSPFMGELTFEELELFHFQHYRFHLWQFGLLESYP